MLRTFPYKGEPDLQLKPSFPVFRYAAMLLPAAIFFGISVLISISQNQARRTELLADQAKLAAANLDLRFEDLLKLTTFCATSPALIVRIDLDTVAENCGRFAEKIGAWIVIVETGTIHRQILNTRFDAPADLPTYPRDNEIPALRALEAHSRESGTAGIADVFTGKVYPKGVVAAGQFLRLPDGREAMLYVGIPVQFISDDLAGLAASSDTIFAVLDPSHRVVARSIDNDGTKFAKAPDWLLERLENGSVGVSLGVPGTNETGGLWDAGYHPLRMAVGWTVAAAQPTPTGLNAWALTFLSSVLTMIGFALSMFLLWAIRFKDDAARKVVTAQRGLEEAQRQNKEKSRLLASFAHDIRSPLISLIGSLELIETGRDASAATAQVHSARVSAEALLQLIDDILELSFLGSGAMRLHPSPVDLRQLAMSVCDHVRQDADRKGLELLLDLDPILPAAVKVDRLRLQQVLTNLLANAVKYTEKGSVTLRVRRKGAEEGRMSLEFAVVDTGIGLAADDIPRILREFGRLDREAEQREQGTGIGLAIVQRVLNQMNSALVIDSTPEQGTTFKFLLVLPVCSAAQLGEAPQTLFGLSILYAEDEPIIRQVTMRRLEEAGAKVVSAVDGMDAVEQLTLMTPDLLLIDLQMPGLDGTALIQRLNEIAPERSYPIFVLTSHISGPQAASARAAGADAIFTKPIQVAALAAAWQARNGNGGQSTPALTEETIETSEPLLDMEIFQEAASLMGTTSLVENFENAMTIELSAIHAASVEGDVLRVREIAHRAQGLCQVTGAVYLAQMLSLIEREATQGNVARVKVLCASVEGLLASSLKEMQSICSDPRHASS